jgi:hypothetical protein
LFSHHPWSQLDATKLPTKLANIVRKKRGQCQVPLRMMMKRSIKMMLKPMTPMNAIRNCFFERGDLVANNLLMVKLCNPTVRNTNKYWAMESSPMTRKLGEKKKVQTDTRNTMSRIEIQIILFELAVM